MASESKKWARHKSFIGRKTYFRPPQTAWVGWPRSSDDSQRLMLGADVDEFPDDFIHPIVIRNPTRTTVLDRRRPKGADQGKSPQGYR
jgi:hypothetical protein